jgi:leucyl-tRNA synthetase
MLSDLDRSRFLVPLDEKAHLIDAKTYLSDVLHCHVEIFSADDADLYDPAKKTKFASPLRPAIYIE